MKTSCLRFEDWVVGVSSSDESDLRWLSAFLECGFDEVPCAPPDRRVALIVDDVAYDRLFRQGTLGSGPTVEGFANDSAPVWFERWPSNGSGSVFHDDRHPIFYVVSDDGASVEILARERTAKCRTALMRVVRELTMDRIVASGGLLVHGSAVSFDGGVVVICGPKRSGKTTLLMSMLQTTEARYVANDRCVLRVTEGSALRPPAVTLRRLEAAEALERLHRGLFRASCSSPLGGVFVSAVEAARRLGPLDSSIRMIQWIGESIACFDCQLGGGSAPGAEECRALLARVSEAGRPS